MTQLFDAIRCDFGADVLEVAEDGSRLVGRSAAAAGTAVFFDVPRVSAAAADTETTFGPRDEDGAFFATAVEAQVLRVWVSDALPVATDCACNAEFRARAEEPRAPPPQNGCDSDNDDCGTAADLAGIWDFHHAEPPEEAARATPRPPFAAFAKISRNGRAVTLSWLCGACKDYELSCNITWSNGARHLVAERAARDRGSRLIIAVRESGAGAAPELRLETGEVFHRRR
jgi:hypothetical protein